MNKDLDWSLRPATTADVEPVAELRAEVMRADLERLGRYDDHRVRQRLRDGFSPQHTSIVLVGREFAGSVAVRPAEQGGRWLEHFYLRPRHQGRGLGSAVLRHVLAEADSAGEPVRLDVLQGSAARRLYERHGFEPEHEDAVDAFLVRPVPAVTVDPAVERLRDAAVLWSAGELTALEVVDAACDALVAGLDGEAVTALAACPNGEASALVPDLLPPALAEYGLLCHPPGGMLGKQTVLRVLAARMLAGEYGPQDLARRVHERFGHDFEPAEALALLDDSYDTLGYHGLTREQLDEDVRAEARRLAGARCGA
ncbi:GNAT family N-acetyltransferase [Kitasatospora sp. NPDC059827]|uniref:GNAT family N-acetyltransferase n=1 Tax=Kitasatospora sp. NPDC059827 TaxID=3346964 RepID=UPI003665FA19